MAYDPGQQAQRAQQPQHAQQPQQAQQAQQSQYVPPNPTSEIPAQPDHQAAAAPKGFLATLFDFDLGTSATPAITKLLYTLGVVAIIIAAVVWLVIDFRIDTGLGILTLFFAPLMTIIDIAFLRLLLELFVHVYELARDVRENRENRERGYRG